MEQQSFLRKLAKGIHLSYEVFVMIILTFMILSVFVNVLTRYVLNYSIGWVDESSRFLFIWLVFLGAVLAYGQNEHIGLDFFLEYVPVKCRRLIVIVAHILVLAVLGVMTIYGYRVALRARNLSPGLGLRMTYVYIVVPLSAALMGLITVKKIVDGVLALFRPTPNISDEKKVNC